MPIQNFIVCHKAGTDLNARNTVSINYKKKITLSSTRQKQQVIGVPAELVREFEIELLQKDEVVARKCMKDNIQRLVKVSFEATECDRIKIHFSKTWGDPCIKVFEVRVY